MVQKVLGSCATKTGTKIDESAQAGENGHERIWKDVGRVLAKNAKGWNVEGRKNMVTRKECYRLLEEFEVGGFMALKGSWNVAKRRMLEDRGALSKEDGDLLREYQAKHQENFLSS